MSVPPELMAALQQAQGGNADPGLPAQDAGYAPDPAPSDQTQGPTAEDLLRQGIMALQQALQAEPDDQDSQQLADIVKQLYAIMADRQKESDGALAGKFSPRMMRRGA